MTTHANSTGLIEQLHEAQHELRLVLQTNVLSVQHHQELQDQEQELRAQIKAITSVLES